MKTTKIPKVAYELFCVFFAYIIYACEASFVLIANKLLVTQICQVISAIINHIMVRTTWTSAKISNHVVFATVATTIHPYPNGRIPVFYHDERADPVGVGLHSLAQMTPELCHWQAL